VLDAVAKSRDERAVVAALFDQHVTNWDLDAGAVGTDGELWL